jgi:uncharacterized membrane protein SpoIIM required for sporulation
MLYRGACSDLAMAEFYQLPPVTVDYLHRLVGRAHNQLYRSRQFEWDQWWRVVSVDVPRAIFSDICVHIAAVVFFGLFAVSAILSQSEQQFPTYAHKIVGEEGLDQVEEMYEKPLEGNFNSYVGAAAYYIQHNTSIGLTCFGKGPLIIPCIIELAFQAIYLGAIFGYMARPGIESGEHFFQFVTAHGPFELTAIALSAAAGLRLGVGLVATAGLMRVESFKLHALRSLPIGGAAVVLFILAAFTEGFLSPSPLPYAYKALWAILSSTVMMFYFVVLGFPRGELDGIR